MVALVVRSSKSGTLRHAFPRSENERMIYAPAASRPFWVATTQKKGRSKRRRSRRLPLRIEHA